VTTTLGRTLLAAGIFVAASCGGGHAEDPRRDAATPDCVDTDGDGFGEGADCSGADCDDDDASRHEACGPVCTLGSLEPGCPCEVGTPAEVCYDGPPGTANVGVCRTGVRLCRDGVWSTCEGMAVPSPETCDSEDDDCDGTVDDGVLSACGDCNADCHIDCVGVGCERDFVVGPGTALRDDGALLAAPLFEAPDDVWIAMRGDDTVLRIDGPTRTPVARYRLGAVQDDAEPSGVVVDGLGNAFALETSWVGTRSSAVVAIRASGCLDRDGDGGVETSIGADALPWGADECVDWRLELEECAEGTCSDASGMTLADDGATLWVSLEEADRVVEVDTATGALTSRSVDVESPRPLAADGQGTLWTGGVNGWLHPVPLADPATDENDDLLAASGIGQLEIGLDGSVYTASPPARLAPGGDALLTFEGDDTPHPILGLVADERGDLWASYDFETLSRWSPDLGEVDTFTVASLPQTLALDRDGMLWAATDDPAAVVILDPEAGAAVLDEVVCDDCLSLPALRGDPTGIRVERSYGPVWARGEATALLSVDCGIEEPGFEAATVTVSSGAAQVELRTAWALEELAAATWRALGTFPPNREARPDDRDPGGFLELRIRVLRPETVVERIDVRWGCYYTSF